MAVQNRANPDFCEPDLPATMMSCPTRGVTPQSHRGSSSAGIGNGGADRALNRKARCALSNGYAWLASKLSPIALMAAIQAFRLPAFGSEVRGEPHSTQ